MPDRHPTTPQIITMGCRGTVPAEMWDWHTHDYDELCMFTDDSCTVGHEGRKMRVKTNTLFLHRRGEVHGFWNSQAEAPDLWVIHFDVQDAFYLELPALISERSEDRIWKLGASEASEFRSLFAKISVEAGRSQSEANVLSSAWLQVLLGCLQRWKSAKPSESFILHELEPDLLDLWKTINDMVPQPFSAIDRLTEMVDGYDSLRHRFRRVFGQSPRAMMQSLRMQRAQHLLLDGQKSVKEIASSVGYVRQHEFSRAFRKAFGVSPSDWRSRPRLYVDRIRHSR